MCVIVAIGIAGYRGDASRLFENRGLRAKPSTNPTALALPGETRLDVTDGHCSCSVYAGGTGRIEFDAERERRRLKRKGWKAARVERELVARGAAHENAHEAPVEESALVAAVRELAANGARVSLLAHMYRASLDDAFVLEGVTELPLVQFSSTGGEFPMDRVVMLIG
jgi:hypothetical protein